MTPAILIPQRALHTHVFQMNARLARRNRECPACQSINLDKMESDYAELSWLIEQRARALQSE